MEPKSTKLTPRQRDIFDFIANYIEIHRYSPAVRDIAREFEFAPNAAQEHVVALTKKGWITRAPGIGRTICILRRS